MRHTTVKITDTNGQEKINRLVEKEIANSNNGKVEITRVAHLGTTSPVVSRKPHKLEGGYYVNHNGRSPIQEALVSILPGLVIVTFKI